MKLFTVLALILLGLLSPSWAEEFSFITDQQLIVRQKNRADFILLDVRTKKEFAQGHLPNALLLTDLKSKKTEDTLSKEKDIIVYCARGGRANTYLKHLRLKGFKNIYHLKGDYTEWKKNGHPIEK